MFAIRRHSVRRKARANFLARRSLPKFLLRLKSQPACDWPSHFFGAWQLLNTELKLPDATARFVVLESVSAAHDCLRAQEHKLHDIVEARSCATIKDACSSISRCISRAPAVLRRRLDRAVLPLIQEPIVDLEVIESIFSAAKATFEEFPTCESCRTALKSLCALQIADFSTLGMTLRRQSEQAITRLTMTSETKRHSRTADVFAALSAVLSSKKSPKINTQTHELLTLYVTQLVTIWRQAGLKPSRASNSADSAYREQDSSFCGICFDWGDGPLGVAT